MPKHGPWFDGISNRPLGQLSGASALKDAVNVVPTKEGGLRSTRTPVLLQGGSFRRVHVFGDTVVLLGNSLTTILTRGSARQLPRTANFAVSTPDGLLFIDDSVVFDDNGNDLCYGSTLPSFAFSGDGLDPGTYRIAFAALRGGREQPCFDVALPTDGEGISVTAPGDGFVFASAANGMELYMVAQVTTNQTVQLPNTPAGRPPLHLNAQPMPGGKYACLHNGTLVVGSGRFVLSSKPYEYGVTDAASMYSAWPAPITGLASADKKLYVGADRLYEVNSEGVDVLIDEPVISVSATSPDQSFVVATVSGVYLVEGGRVTDALSDTFAGPHVVGASAVIADRFPFDGIVAAIDHDGWPLGVQPLTL